MIVAKHGHTIVERNLLKRRLKELARTRIIPQLNAVDVVVRSLPVAYGASFDVLEAEVSKIVQELSLKTQER